MLRGAGFLSALLGCTPLRTLSPLASVAAALSSDGARVAAQAQATGPPSSRAFHSSPPALGGRYTSQIPDKKKHWRANLSKKATKRLDRQRETTVRRAKMMPQLLSSREARVAPPARKAPPPAPLPSPALLEARSSANRTIIESIVLPDSAPVRAGEALKREDSASFERAMDRGNGSSWTHLIRIHGAQGKMGKAMEAYAGMRGAGLSPTAHTLSALLFAACTSRSLAAAQAIWATLTGSPAPGSASAATGGSLPSSSSALARPGPARVVPNSACYGGLMQAHLRALDLTGAFEVLAAAGKYKADMSNPILWTHLVVGCVHAGQYERAIETFEHMRTYHAQPDAVAYTALISACAKMDRVERVLDLMTEMRRMGVVPTDVTYNAAIHAAGRSLRLHVHAHELLGEMESHGLPLSLRSYAGVLLACSQTGDVARAREYMARLMGEGLSPDLRTMNVMLAVYARGLAQAAKKVPSGLKGRGQALPATLVGQLRAEGSELLTLAEEGALSVDAKEVEAAEAAMGIEEGDALTRSVMPASVRELRYGDARRVLGDSATLVDELLGDYFGAAKRTDPLEDAMEDGAIHSDDEAFSVPTTARDIMKADDPEWLRLRAALADSGVIPTDLLDDLEQEYGRPPPANEEEETERGAEYEERHRARLARLGEEAVVDAREEEAAMGADGMRTAYVPRFDDEDMEEDEEGEVIDVLSSPSSGGGGSAPSPGLGLGGVFSDVLDHAQGIVSNAPRARGGGRPQLSSSSSLILDAAATGTRIRMRSYMAALEREVMEASLGPEWAYAPADEGEAVAAMELGARLADAEDADARAVEKLDEDDDWTGSEEEEEEEGGAPADPSAALTPTVARAPPLVPTTAASSPPSAPTNASPPALRSADGKAFFVLRRRWVSMFGEGTEEGLGGALGGVRLADLFDTSTIPLPPALTKRLARAIPGNAEPDWADLEQIDLGEVYEHTEAVMRARLQAALVREACGLTGAIATPEAVDVGMRARARRMAEQLSLRRTLYEDPLLSDGAPDYAAMAGVKLPEMGDGGSGSEGEEDRESSPSQQRLVTQRTLAGLREQLRAGSVVPASDPTAASSLPEENSSFMRLPAEGEEMLLTPALSASDPVRAPRSGAAPPTDSKGLTPKQRAHRSFTARLLSRLLSVHPAGPVEVGLTVAAESVDKRRQRLLTGEKPRLLDALFAVQRLRERVAPAAAPASAPAGPAAEAAVEAWNAAGSPSDVGELLELGLSEQAEAASAVVRASPTVAAAVAARHAERQAKAVAGLLASAEASPASSARLAGLSGLSNKLLAGAAWLPSEPYPLDRAARRKVLLVEMRRIVRHELPASGLTPDRITLNTLLTAYGAVGDAASAYSVLREAFPAHALTPDARSFRALIKMHVHRREIDRATELLTTVMPAMGITPDADSYGAIVHGRAREWRVRDAIVIVQAAKSAGLVIPEAHARLLRARCKAMGVVHPDVPEHPVGWQFSPAIMAKRFEGAKSKAIRREWMQALRPRMRDNMR